MMKKIKQILAILAGAALVLGLLPSMTTHAQTYGHNGYEWNLIDDQGEYCSRYFSGYLDSTFNPDNYYVFEEIRDSDDINGHIQILSNMHFNYATFEVSDEEIFMQTYEKYADALNYDVVDDSYYNKNSCVFLYDTQGEDLSLSDEKIAVLTDLAKDLNDLGILSYARYSAVTANQNYIHYIKFLKVSLPYEDYDALNAICEEYGTEVSYYGDADACRFLDENESALANLENKSYSEERKAEIYATLMKCIDQYTQQIENVADEDCQFGIYTGDFISQCELMDAIYDAFPDAEIEFDKEWQGLSALILNEVQTADLMQLAEEQTEDTAIDIICGDVNFDGAINLSDVVTLSKASSGVVDVTDNMNAAGDIDGDGEISESDSLVLLNFEMGLVRAIPLATNT